MLSRWTYHTSLRAWVCSLRTPHRKAVRWCTAIVPGLVGWMQKDPFLTCQAKQITNFSPPDRKGSLLLQQTGVRRENCTLCGVVRGARRLQSYSPSPRSIKNLTFKAWKELKVQKRAPKLNIHSYYKLLWPNVSNRLRDILASLSSL